MKEQTINNGKNVANLKKESNIVDDYKKMLDIEKIISESSKVKLKFRDWYAKEMYKIQEETHTYGKYLIAIRFTSKWAKIMQYLKEEEGQDIKDIAILAAKIAGSDNLPPSVCRYAKYILTDYWKYGDDLRCIIFSF